MYRLGDTDEEMVKDLKDLGFRVLITRVTRIRKKLGLVRRITALNRQEADTQLFDILRAKLDDGRIVGYRRRHL
jgi:G:T-mismatch repair DNA endonuclease (very short patch repair protein)